MTNHRKAHREASLHQPRLRAWGAESGRRGMGLPSMSRNRRRWTLNHLAVDQRFFSMAPCVSWLARHPAPFHDTGNPAAAGVAAPLWQSALNN